MIQLTGVKRAFRKALTPHEPTVAFSLQDFQVAEGEKLALVGPSGCGKSTLLNLIAGLIKPDAGTIDVCGEKMEQLSESQADRFRGKTIGFVYQAFNLVPALTAMENVLLGLRFGRTLPRNQWTVRAREMLSRVGLGHRMNYRPGQLSIGEQQRVAIARALVNHPAIVLADEPTGSLDPSSSGSVFKLLLEVCSEGTHALLVVTHDMKVAEGLPRIFDCSTLVQESDHPL